MRARCSEYLFSDACSCPMGGPYRLRFFFFFLYFVGDHCVGIGKVANNFLHLNCLFGMLHPRRGIHTSARNTYLGCTSYFPHMIGV